MLRGLKCLQVPFGKSVPKSVTWRFLMESFYFAHMNRIIAALDNGQRKIKQGYSPRARKLMHEPKILQWSADIYFRPWKWFTKFAI